MTDNQSFDYTDNGDNSGTLTGGLLVPGGGNIQINGNSLDGIFGGEIHSIQVTEIDGTIYKWQVEVNGRADHFGKNWYFHFTDESPDTYALSIISSIVENHYVDYNSDAPNINKIEWTKS